MALFIYMQLAVVYAASRTLGVNMRWARARARLIEPSLIVQQALEP